VLQSNGVIEAVYFNLSSKPSHKSKEIGPNGEVVIDLDEDGQPVGIEMLAPGHVTIQQIKKISKRYNIPDLERFRPKRLQEVFA
jgi:uncharacterized protein YuzE